MTTRTRTSPSPAAQRAPLGRSLALLAFAQLIVSIDYNIVFVALPDIGRDLGFSSQTLQWVVSSYAVAFGGLLLLGGRAADLLGRRRMFVTGLALYLLASLAGGLADAPGTLIAARAVQGVGGALLFPATLSLVTTLFAEGSERNRALSVWSGAGAGGLVLGSLVGGLLTEGFGWRADLFVNVPLAALAIGFAFRFLDRDDVRDRARRFDLPGTILGTTGIVALVVALVQAPDLGWTSPDTALIALVAVVLLAAFVLVEHRTADPVLPLRMFANRDLRTGVVITFLFTSTFGSLLYFLTVYFQNVHGYTALQTGVAYLVPMVLVLSGNALGGVLLTRLGVRRTLLTALPVLAVGMVVLALSLSPHGAYVALIPGLALVGVAGGVTFTSMFAAASSGVAPHEQGIASGIASTGQQIGSAVGLAILVAVANAGTDGLTGDALRDATAGNLRTTVLVAAAGVAVMIVAALNFSRAPHDNESGADHD